MKQFHLEVKENEDLARGRKVFDQTIYVSALERGTRDRSPRRVGPLPDRIEFKICPQKNHRGRMNYYRARSIPELCRITLTPTGETSNQQGRMEEVYITQYTHSFDREIEKPHVVAWKRAFEDSDVAHRDSKLCIVNSPVGSKNEGYPERRKSAPPGSFVFNYDTLDVPEPVLRRSKSLGISMNDLVDFDSMDTQVGASPGGNIDLEMGESTSGKMRPLAHEIISAQKQEQVESVDLSFWGDDAFNSFDDGETSNNTTNSVRNGHVTTGDSAVNNVGADSATTSYVRNADVRSGDVTTGYVRNDDVRGGHITTSYVRSGDVTSDDFSPNGLNVPCDEITHDSREHYMQDPTKQALSLINTLRSTVKKPDSQMFLRSVHETQTFSESTGKNHVPRKNQSKEPTPQKLPEQGVLYRSTVPPRTSSTREYPQKVTPRIISNPRKECTYQTVRQHEVLPRKPVLPEKKSRKKLLPEIMPGKVAPREDLPRKMDTQVETQLNSDPMRNYPKDEAHVNHEYGLVKKKYISKYEPTTTVPNHSTSKPKNSYLESDEKEKLSKRNVDQDGVKTSHFSRPKKQTGSELQDTSYDSYENVHVKSLPSTKVSDKNHQSLGSSELRFESATTDQKEDYYQEPKLVLNTMEGSETHYSIPPKHFENYQPRSAINVTSEHMTPDQNEDHYQEPKLILNTVERSEADYNTQQHGENHQPRSAMNIITPEHVTPEQNEEYYQEPDREVKRNKTVGTHDHNHPTQSQSTESPTSEQVSKQRYEEYHKQPNFEEKTLSGYSKQDENTVLDITSTSSVFPEEDGSQTLNEDYYQNVDKRMRETVVTNYNVHSKQDGSTVKDRTSNASSEQVTRNEDHYQIPNSLVIKLKPPETSYDSRVEQAGHTTYSTTVEGTTRSQEEDHYQQPNSDVNTLKTVEVNQSFHLKRETDYNKNGKPTLEQEGNYYQQPNLSARKMEAQNQPQRYDEDARYHDDSQIAGRTLEAHTPDEHYYQQPRLDPKTVPAQTLLTKPQTNSNVYEEPKHSTTPLQKCPLDQSDMQRNDNDYNKPLPKVPTERKTSETYYETPKDAYSSSMKCPIDETDAERSVTGDYFGQTVEHIYEQPNFETERVYEQFDYEKMNAPQPKFAPGSSFKKVSDSEKDEIYEQPDKMVYVNVEDKKDRKHLDSRMKCKVIKAQHLEDTPGEVYHKPSMKQENTKKGETLVPEILHTIQAEKQNNTSSTVSTAETPDHSDAVSPNHKQTDYQQPSITSLRSMNDLKKDFKSTDQSTRIKYGGEINTKKSMVSSTSSLAPNQSDDRISNNSPNNQSAYSEGEVLPQKPEAEVCQERTRVKPKAVNGEKTKYDEISPSTYSKDNSGNTSLARFSSFNSEASYKRRLTSAWIEQQRINFRKNVSREPSLRRTKSVEFHKERAASEDAADYKLKHSKSELSFEHLDAMYEPFDDKYFDTNPNKHPVKVVHAAPSEVFTKAKSLERRVEKPEEPEYYSQENIPSNTDSLTRSRGQNAKDESPESRRVFVEEIISRQDGMETNSEVKPWREPNKKSKVRPKSADVSEFDRKTFNDETEQLWIGERPLRDPEFCQRSKPRTNSTDVSGFDVTKFKDGGTNLPMEENDDRLENNKSKPSPVYQRSRLRPKSADVTTFDITSYNERQQNVSMEEKDKRLAKNQSKTSSVQKSKVRPKSADVSGFDVMTCNGDEPTLKHSKSEVSVDQLKAMYDPYDQNSWFSPGPASQNVNQSNTVQVEATVHDVVHRRTRSQPESRLDRSENGRKPSKREITSLQSEPVKNITKLDSSSVLLLNVVEVEQSGQPKNSKFIRNVSGNSYSNVVSVTASEIENEKHLTMSETKGRESTRNTKQNNSDATKSSTDQIIQNEKPVEKYRARYIIGGERASVRYLSKSTDELTSNDNETIKETLPEPQGEQKPLKATKKDGRFLNLFGRMRKSKSEPNLDKNFDILDIDSDHGGKKENSKKFKEPEKNFSETPYKNSKGKSPNSSKSLKNSFYPKLKNLTKNFSKSKLSKTDGSFIDSGVDSGKDISTNQEFLETSVISGSKVERENVEITESQVVLSENVASRKIDSSISSQSVNSTKSAQYHASKHEIPQLFVQIEQRSAQKDKETETISPSSPVTSPKSAKKRFFQGGNRVKPFTVAVKDSDNNPGRTQGKTTSNSVVTSQGSHKSIASEESLEKRKRIINTPLPPTPTDKHQDRITETSVSRSVDDPALNSRPVRFEADSKLPEDQTQLPSTSKESIHREAKETSYRITEITGKRERVSDGNNSRFTGSSTRGEHLKSIDQSASDSVVTYKNNTDKICEITLQAEDSKNPDINSRREESKAKQNKESEIAKPKHRSFFKTKISTSAGKASSPQGRDSPERKGKKEDRKEHEGARETEGRGTEDSGQDSIVIKDDTLDNSNPVLKEESTLSSSKEITKSREALKEGKKVKKQSLKDKEDKEKSEFGTKIKGFITKVLPQKDAKKSSSKENSVNEAPGKTTVSESEGSPDENNNPTTTTISLNDDNQQPNTSFITKSRRSIFVAKHLGESDTEKTRTSEEEGSEVRVETKKLTTSHPDKSERRYVSKAEHVGDHKTIKTKSTEKHTGQRFLTVEAEDIMRGNLRESGVGSTNGKRSFPKRDAFEPKQLQDESISKTEVMDNVEAFDSVFDFFENEFNDEERIDGKEESLPKPNEQEHSKEFKKVSSGLVVLSNTLGHGRNFRVSNENENRVKRDDNQLARDDRINGLKGSGGHMYTTHVNVNTTDAKCNKISSNVHTKGDMPKETTANEKQRNLEQIKGFTIKHTKTSSLVLNKSIEDDLEKVGKDSDENAQENLKHQELNTNQVESPRNAKTHITTSANKADHGRSVEIEKNETTPKTTASSSVFLTKDEEDTDQQLKYVEKVMVSVHRGASDVKRLVQESNAQSSDVHSTPVSTPLLHSRQSSGESYDGQSSRVDLTREMSGAEKKVVRSVEKSLQNDITSDEPSFSGRRPSEHNRTGSRDDDSKSKVILTREMPAESSRLARLSPERNFRSGITNQDKKRVLKMNGDWGDVVEEFLTTNKTETISSDVKKRHGDELFEFIEEQLVLEKTSEQLQPDDSSTPIQDENMKNRSKSGHHDFTNSSFSSTTRTTSKSLEMVDKTEGSRLDTPADVEETKEFSTSRNATTSSGPHITTARAASSTPTNLVKTSEIITSLPPSNAVTVSRTKTRTRPLSGNFEEQRRESIPRTATLLQQQNETVASQKLARPKSFLNKNTKKNTVTVSMSDGDNRLKETTDSNGVSSSTKNTQRNSKNEVLNTNVELKEKAKRKPPPVLPKPKRNKGKEISQVKTEDPRHEDQRKVIGFIDAQNNNPSLVNFQSFQGNYKGNAGRDEPRFKSFQSFETRENFTSGKAINSERKEKYESVTSVKQFKNQRMIKSDATFNQYKNGESTSGTLGQVENNKGTTSNGRKQRRQGGTTVSDTSEDLAIRLQRLLCEDEFMSEPDDSSATHEVASTVYSFSEDSEFDRNLMELRYKNPLRSRKPPATLRNPRSSHIPLDDSSDDEVFGNNTKLNYAIHSKTL